MINLIDVNKYYKIGDESLHVLNNINLSVSKGDYISILGESGSGKSTLMNIIGCMDGFDEGTYSFNSISIHDCADYELGRVRNEYIGFIFQKYHLIQQYTVLQNVMMPLLIRGMLRDEAKALALKSIARVKLSDRVNHKPNELSGGQQQRVAIARALVTRPSLLLADEPTGALDSKTSKEILALFKELNEEGHTILMITHDQNVANYSKRKLMLDDGVLSEIF